jgi:hypothetical protein
MVGVPSVRTRNASGQRVVRAPRRAKKAAPNRRVQSVKKARVARRPSSSASKAITAKRACSRCHKKLSAKQFRDVGNGRLSSQCDLCIKADQRARTERTRRRKRGLSVPDRAKQLGTCARCKHRRLDTEFGRQPSGQRRRICNACWGPTQSETRAEPDASARPEALPKPAKCKRCQQAQPQEQFGRMPSGYRRRICTPCITREQESRESEKAERIAADELATSRVCRSCKARFPARAFARSASRQGAGLAVTYYDECKRCRDSEAAAVAARLSELAFGIAPWRFNEVDEYANPLPRKAL